MQPVFVDSDRIISVKAWGQFFNSRKTVPE